MEGLEREGMVKDKSLLFPLLSTVSYKNKCGENEVSVGHLGLSPTGALEGSPGYKFPATEPLHSHCGGAPCWQCGAGTPRSALVGTAV